MQVNYIQGHFRFNYGWRLVRHQMTLTTLSNWVTLGSFPFLINKGWIRYDHLWSAEEGACHNGNIVITNIPQIDPMLSGANISRSADLRKHQCTYYRSFGCHLLCLSYSIFYWHLQKFYISCPCKYIVSSLQTNDSEWGQIQRSVSA